MFTFIKFNEYIETAKEILEDEFNNFEYDQSGYILMIEPITREGIELDSIGFTIDITNKSVIGLRLVHEGGSSFDLLTEKEKQFISNALKESGTLDYSINKVSEKYYNANDINDYIEVEEYQLSY